MRVQDISIRDGVPGNVHTVGGCAVWEFKLNLSHAPCQTWQQAFSSEAVKPEFSAVAKYTLLANRGSEENWTLVGTCASSPQLLRSALYNAATVVQRANEAVRAEGVRQSALQKERATQAEREARAREQQQREFEQTFRSAVAPSGFRKQFHLSLRWKIFIGGVIVGVIAGRTTDDWGFGVHIVATVGITLLWWLHMERPSMSGGSYRGAEEEGSLALFFLGLWISLILRLWKGDY
jgi:hypothetical protein